MISHSHSSNNILITPSLMSYDNVVSNLFIGLMRKHTTDYLFRDIPCSIHEFIIVPFYEGDDFDKYYKGIHLITISVEFYYFGNLPLDV